MTRRRIARVLLSVLFGAIATVAVSWACSIRTSSAVSGTWHVDGADWASAVGVEEPLVWPLPVPVDFGHRPTSVSNHRSLGNARSTFTSHPPVGTVPIPVADGQLAMWYRVVNVEESGWPLRAFASRTAAAADVRETSPPHDVHFRHVVQSGSLTLGDDKSGWRVPYFPLWLGLSVDTALYASLAWLALWGASALHTRRQTHVPVPA